MATQDERVWDATPAVTLYYRGFQFPDAAVPHPFRTNLQ